MRQSGEHIAIGGRWKRDESGDTWSIGSGVITSLLLHGFIVGAMVLATMWSEDDLDEKVDKKMMEFEDVKLLKLGERKPPDELPRIANPAPESAAEDTVALDQKDKPKPDKKDEPEPDPTPAKERRKKAEPSEAKPPEKNNAVDQAFQDAFNPNRPANNVTPEGSEKGVSEGTVNDAALANMMNTYQARLIQKLVSIWHVPTTVSEKQAQKLAGQVVVAVQLSSDGHISSYRFVQKSSNEQFNGSVERVLRRFQSSGGGQTLPLPDPEPARKQVLQRGLDLKNWDPTL